jgi:hypothetical protein
MVLAQRARDAMLADNLLATTRDGAVLIAGVGHVRVDRGVPAYLRAREPGAVIAAVAPLEVRDDWTRPLDYAASLDGTLPYDWVWFTPRPRSRADAHGGVAPPRVDQERQARKPR